jgi:DNA-binding transcriptional LysR family regulator
MDAVLAFVRGGLGAAIVPELAARYKAVHILEITGTPLERRIGLIFHKDRHLPRPAQALATQLMDDCAAKT